MKRKTLVISGHPDLKSSYANNAILKQLEASDLDLNIRHLGELYSDFRIDVEAEQKALLQADIVVLQFPLFWYSVPALLKHWIDEVFTYGFAYGTSGDKLKDKDFLLSMTVGGPSASYDPLGYNNFPIDELLKPLQNSAYMAKMIYHPPLTSFRMVFMPDVLNTEEAIIERSADHADRLLVRLHNIAEGSVENPVDDPGWD